MSEDIKTENQLSIEELSKENRNLKRQLRNLESTLQRDKAMLAARITVNSMLESEQRKMERNMNLLLENSADIILLFDKDGRFSYFTDIFLKETGIAGAGLVSGRHFTEIFSQLAPKEWIGFMQENFDFAMGQRNTVNVNSSIDLSGGNNPKDYDIQITPMMDQKGQLEAVMMLFHDMTDAIRDKRQAESASVAKSQFLATMSHEMRTPLNAVLGMASIGKATHEMERMLYCFTKIEEASQHLLGVINDILDMSKIEAEKFELSPTEFAFEKMLQKVVNVVNFRVYEKKQKLAVRIDKSIPGILFGDDQRLAQVITNLLGNAVKFTPNGGAISLDAALLEELDGVCTIKVTVTDTGIGISPEQQAHLFRSFQQAESDTTRKFGGTGLGLSISKSIVEMMGGKVQVESELGKGAAFSFVVQLKRGEEKKQGSAELGVNLGNVRILVVDDDSGVPVFFKDSLQVPGLSCDIADEVSDALRLVEQNGEYDVYFVSRRVSGIGGVDLIKELRAKAAVPANSVVMMGSAAEWIEIEEDAKESGIGRFAAKPLFASDVLDIINECLGIGGKPDASQESSVDDFTGHCILLAEDVEIDREIVLALLEQTGIAIDCAENGAVAVRMFSEAPEKYEVIFMDVQMPEMDGYEATRRIRALETPNAKTIPIIAMTANVFRDDVEKCIAAGMNAHIGKPLDFDEVNRQLRFCISGTERGAGVCAE